MPGPRTIGLRPLTKKGKAAGRGAGRRCSRTATVDRVLSSPSVRCVQTVRPLALARRSRVEEVPRSPKARSARDAIELLRTTGGGVVACSHGDVIPAVVTSLAAGASSCVDAPAWKKGSTWVLERDGGLFTTARYLPPPGSAPGPSD